MKVGMALYEGLSVTVDALVRGLGTTFLEPLFILGWLLEGASRLISVGFLEFEKLP